MRRNGMRLLLAAGAVGAVLLGPGMHSAKAEPSQRSVDYDACRDGQTGGTNDPPPNTVDRDEYCCKSVGGTWITEKYPDGTEIYRCDLPPDDEQTQPTATPNPRVGQTGTTKTTYTTPTPAPRASTSGAGTAMR
jgi:hypothetical protein